MAQARGSKDDVQGNGKVVRRPVTRRPVARGGADDAAGNAKTTKAPKARATKKAAVRRSDDAGGHSKVRGAVKKAKKAT